MTSLHITCPSCGTANGESLGRLPESEWFAGKRLQRPLAGGSLVRCRQCCLKFRFPVQSEQHYQELYDNSVVSTWPEDSNRADWNLISRYLSERLPQGASVLDFGCYTGGLLSRLDGGYQKYGIEINAQAALLAAQRAKATLWPSLAGVPEEHLFDAIIASDVIEHMAHPRQFLEQISRHLKRNGVLVLTTGDANNSNWDRFGASWWYCFYPEHISFISRAWLDSTVDSLGLQTQHCKPFRYVTLTPPRFVLDGLLAFVYGYFPRLFLAFRSRLEAVTGAKGSRGVPGNGISRDHLFIVLRPKVRRGQ
ncbi:methyltransferase domain-containing protein [Dyella kyungheensis]|uniref:class I SAM-dependent methyltransferase n=1 Tax=Dyella kyungheensis TaxID=1242174 RepID=UPI003CF17DED